MKKAALLALLFSLGSAQAQNCPPPPTYGTLQKIGTFMSIPAITQPYDQQMRNYWACMNGQPPPPMVSQQSYQPQPIPPNSIAPLNLPQYQPNPGVQFQNSYAPSVPFQQQNYNFPQPVTPQAVYCDPTYGGGVACH